MRDLSTFSDEAGMTLIETLVALAILSLISLFLFSGLRTGSALWLKHEDRSDETSRIVMTQDLLRELIEKTYPGMPPATIGTGRVLFQGSPTEMAFISFLPERVSPGGLHKVSLALTDGRELRLAWSDTGADPFSPDTGVGGERRQTILLSDLQSFEVSYYGLKDGDHGAAWHNSWGQQRKLPQLVRFRAAIAKTSIAWPDQIIATRIDVDAKCVYDPLTYGCRGR